MLAWGMDALRPLVSILLALAAVALVVREAVRRGAVPPRLVPPAGDLAGRDPAWPLRAAAALLVLAIVLWVTVAGPVATVGAVVESQPEDLATPQLFAVHFFLAVSVLALYALGYLPAHGRATSLAQVTGLRAASVTKELGIGLAAGFAIWLAVVLLLVMLAFLVTLFGGADALPGDPPPMVVWIAGLPLLVRAAVSLSAGFFEEVFFRGLLQPRVGIGLSTVFFAGAHLSYDQPFMLVGVTILSLLFAGLTVWRRSIWAAVAAHTVFDLVQLLVVIPMVVGL